MKRCVVTCKTRRGVHIALTDGPEEVSYLIKELYDTDIEVFKTETYPTPEEAEYAYKGMKSTLQICPGVTIDYLYESVWGTRAKAIGNNISESDLGPLGKIEAWLAIGNRVNNELNSHRGYRMFTLNNM